MNLDPQKQEAHPRDVSGNIWALKQEPAWKVPLYIFLITVISLGTLIAFLR